MTDKPTGSRPAGKKKVLGLEERARALLASLPPLSEMGVGGSIFDQAQAQAYSCYAGICQPKEGDDPHTDKRLHTINADQLWPDDNDPLVPPLGEAAHDQLRAHILGEYFPCVGARAAFIQGTYRFGFYKSLGHLSTVAAMGRDLRRFTQEYEKIGEFTTFIAAFKHPNVTSETEFESLLWQHLQLMHDYDIDDWDPHYSPDPKAKNFGFSFNGHAFFVLGMHAGASRFARRFAFPMLIFNPESQIRRLKEAAILESFAKTVRQRDTLYQGSINPSLPKSSESTGGEARVYSGKAHQEGDGWHCPFSPRQEVLAVHRSRQKHARKKNQ